MFFEDILIANSKTCDIKSIEISLGKFKIEKILLHRFFQLWDMMQTQVNQKYLKE